MRVAAVNQNITGLEERSERINDGIHDISGRHHHPYDAGFIQFRNEQFS